MERKRQTLSRERGQTLIIAMIILGLLLILGFVFLGIVDRNIRGGANAKVRSQSDDLAEAGVRFAQQELLDSPAGADWRGAPTTLAGLTAYPNFTRDPDAYYLRPGSGVLLPNNSNQIDLGGPDGLGFFVRVNYDQGRSLIRVRYGPSDANLFNASPTGPLRSPGLVRNYLIIESIGRQGIINTNDPTTLASASLYPNGIQFQNFATSADLQTAFSALKQFDSQNPNSRHLEAFATTGLIDNARFITNKFNVNRAADIGPANPLVGTNEYLPGVGIDYLGSDIGSSLTYQLGTTQTIAAPSTNQVPDGFGSLMSNMDVTFHGTTQLNLNSTFGDGLRVAGNILGDDNAQLQINASSYTSATNSWLINSQTLASPKFTTRSSAYTTLQGLLEDGLVGTDSSGYARGVGRLVPPSILRQDPQSKLNRYLTLTKGVNGAASVAGANGHGNGVYVGNFSDVQAPGDEAGRAGTGSTESLMYDWFNPNNTSATTGWEGPFYVPVGAVVQLLSDGFTIQLDSGTWPDQSTNIRRYRVGMVNNQEYIVDSEEDPGDINNATGLQFVAQGVPFNGVLYFEGNARVRGIIPTDVQLTLVSGATIYIDGSIIKGATGNDVTDAYASTDPRYAAYGATLKRLSKSTLMLMAKDYVAVNTTQFVGIQPSAGVTTLNDQQNDTGFNAVRVPASNGQLNLQAEFLTDFLSGTGGNPSTYVPYATEYTDSLTAGNPPLNTKLLLSQTRADGSGQSFIGMSVNPGIYGASQAAGSFYFPGSDTNMLPYPDFRNTASEYLYQLGDIASKSQYITTYGLGIDPWQQYDKFESRGFDLIIGGKTAFNSATGILSNTAPNASPFINYDLFAPGGNTLAISTTSIVGAQADDYLLARVSIAPHDVKIEASVYAEEGSFVVIPGPWFNPNPNDTRVAYNTTVSNFVNGGSTMAIAEAQANQQRQASYGNAPEIPFYGEPLDERIQIIGSVSENTPPPLSYQNEWVKKWGWIPVSTGATGVGIPQQHVPSNIAATANGIVPNLVISYDPALATGRAAGFSATNATTDLIRTDEYGRALLPMPRLPVSPALTYFGDVQ